MEKEAKTKKKLVEDLADLREQPADVKKSRSDTKKSLQALQASESRYRRLFETAQDGILILNAETGEIDDVNPYMIHMLHYSREEFLGMKLWEVSPFKDTIFNRAAFEELQDKGYIRYKNLPLETKEGKAVAVEFISNAYKANENKVIQCNIRNITEREGVNRQLQEAIIFQQRLIDALPVPIFYKDFEGRYLGCNSSFEEFFGQKREYVTGKSVYDLSPKEFADIYHEKDLALLQNPGIQVYESKVKDAVGVVHNVVFHKATFPNKDGSVGGLIGAILDITGRKLAEERYRSIFEDAQEGIFRSTPDGKVIMANQAMAKMYGYESPEEMMAGITDVARQHYVNPEDRRKLKEMIEEHGFIKRYEAQNCRKDGSIIWISRTMHAVRDEKGQIIYYDGIMEDITNRKQAEEALKKSENKYRLLADNVSDVIFVLDMNLNYTYVSPSIKVLRGYEPEEVLKQPSFETLTPSSWDLSMRALSKVMKLEKSEHRDINISRTLQLEMVRKDGTTVWTEAKFSFIRDENQRPVGILGVTREITERKQVEEELKQSEERYRSIFEDAQEGIFRSTPDGRIIISNQALAKMFGYESPEEMMTSVTDMARQHSVNPEDRRKLQEMIEEHGLIKGFELQNNRKDGSIIWISLTMHRVRDEKGQIMYYDGIIEEITNRKQKAERIRKALGATVQAIAVTVETRDPYTAGHQQRVSHLARAISTEMNLSTDRIDGIRIAASIHDLGKISVPAEILSKPTKLTDLEFGLIKTHSQSGYDILKDIDFPWPIARMVLEHHERMNGSGYPNGLTGDNILMESRILSVADVVEAMASHRPYRPSLGIEAALEEIEKNRGTLYDNTVADACLRLFREKSYQLP